MGFLSKLFGGKQKSATGSSGQPDLQFYEKLIDNIAVSDELIAGLKATIKLAFENPKYFYDDASDFPLSERGLSFPEDAHSTQKFVLIDKMRAAGQMAEVDWKEKEDEIRFSIIEIIKAKEYNLSVSTDNKYMLETFEIIKSINDNELQPKGYSLEILDINSDSYVFTIVPAEKKDLVRNMFDKLQ